MGGQSTAPAGARRPAVAGGTGAGGDGGPAGPPQDCDRRRKASAARANESATLPTVWRACDV